MATPWGIQSISYPNPLADGERTWNRLETFVQFEKYADAKASMTPKDNSKSTMVETLKAALESFGLLWVRPDERIEVTPGGSQYIEAVNAQDERRVAWIGLNLLLRCPLGGPRGTWRRSAHRESDLPVYWALMASLLDLDGMIHWEELGRVLCVVESREALPGALDQIRAMRSGDLPLEKVPGPGGHHKGDLYNRLNMAMLHVGLGNLLVERSRDDHYVNQGGKARRESVRPNWPRESIELAMGSGGACSLETPFAERLPVAFSGTDLEERFAILGAAVEDQPLSGASGPVKVSLGPDDAWLIDEYDMNVSEGAVEGPTTLLCRVAKGERVILRSVETHTFLVQDKVLKAGGVELKIRPARLIRRPDIVRAEFKERYGD
ncbi:hypothetical protein HJD18_12500 [Thermoleophilia bacterium SCSIO 60948]|nr:hypothetical protein HJD18_12500 [Thermoleophilia bacterium SCSIO 60948]